MANNKVATKIADRIINTIRSGNKILICGNGGSASQSQHFAAELIGKFEHVRQALPAIALTTDTSALTAIGNDFGFQFVFSRQVEALGKQGDLIIGISTSGKSKNVILAYKEAGLRGMGIIDFPREGNTTSEVQEYQLKLMHDICRKVEYDFMFSSSK